MENSHTELEQFLTWFSEQEDIPLQTRRDFFRHVMEVGGIDKKGQKFIDVTLEQLVKRSEKKAQVLKNKIALLNAALVIQKIPELSLKEKIVKGVSGWMMEKAQTFKTKFRAKESKIMKAEESAEEMENKALAARLKASLS